jgi:hypothetical protein
MSDSSSCTPAPLPGSVPSAAVTERPQPTAPFGQYGRDVEVVVPQAVLGAVIPNPLTPTGDVYKVPVPAESWHTWHTNVPAPDTWVYRKDWHRVFLYRLLALEPSRTPLQSGESGVNEDGIYQCQMPRAPGVVCGEVVRDRNCRGVDLESHAASVHGVEQFPQRFRRPSKQWGTSLCDCGSDIPACVDCVFCSCCFIARLNTVTRLRYERNVQPFVASAKGEATGCTQGWCGVGCGFLCQPFLTLFCFPCAVCGFCDDKPERFLCCWKAYPAIGRTKNFQHIEESDCESKCKTFWCCPFALCQTYRELRLAGVNPGLTCVNREPIDRYSTEASRRYHAIGQPTLRDILEDNSGGFPRGALHSGAWSSNGHAGVWTPAMS